ncbi:Brain and acute leukemia cytoplasmic protein, partial [Tinamus guttatus]
ADAIEPRYYESWTRETESTWLTNTDSESPPQGDGAEPAPRPGEGERQRTAQPYSSPETGKGIIFGRNTSYLCFSLSILEDGKSTQTGVTTASATTGILSTEKKASGGSQRASAAPPAAPAAAPRPSSFRTAESKRDTKKMPTKEVTINVAKSIRQSDRRLAKNCVN